MEKYLVVVRIVGAFSVIQNKFLLLNGFFFGFVEIIIYMPYNLQVGVYKVCDFQCIQSPVPTTTDSVLPLKRNPVPIGSRSRSHLPC